MTPKTLVIFQHTTNFKLDSYIRFYALNILLPVQKIFPFYNFD